MQALTLILGSAWASSPVIHAEGQDGSMAVARVAVATGRSPSELQPTTLAALVHGHGPTLAGAGSVERCGAEWVSKADVVAALDEAEGAVAYMELAAATAALDKASSGVRCLSEPADPELLARGWFLRAIVAQGAGDKPAAWAAFGQAMVFDPELRWDENFPPAAKPLFEAARAEQKSTPPVTLTVHPGDDQGQTLIDGRLVQADRGVPLPPGEHLVQAGDQSLWLELRAGFDSTLLIPEALPGEALAWAGEPTRQASLAAVVAACRGGAEPAWFLAGDSIWQLNSDGTWAQLELGPTRLKFSMEVVQPATDPTASPAEPPAKGLTLGRSLQLGGAAVALTGGAIFGLGYSPARTAWLDASQATTWDAFEEASARYEPATRKMRIGEIVAGVGAGLVLGGTLLDASFALVPTPGGLAVELKR